MKIALVHDYLNDYGGAERVLKALSELYPEAPIYTAFVVKDSSAYKVFKDKKIITSWFQYVPYFWRLYSPLRFFIPFIWGPPVGGWDLNAYDLVISSASWYITKGFGAKTEICYCHTPPRWLYGYSTSVDMQKWWPVRVYALVVGHFLRIYDYYQAQKVTQFIANSQEVARRITKFYRRESIVVYPPVDGPQDSRLKIQDSRDYYLIVSRLVGAKGLEMALELSKHEDINLKIAGDSWGYANLKSEILKHKNVEYLGHVSDEEKFKLMTNAKGFLALARDEDFGITPVESMMCGTPVIAFDGGGYKETVVHGKTGILFDDYSVEGLAKAIKVFEKTTWDRKKIAIYAKKFSKERFKKEIRKLVFKYLTPNPSPNLGEGNQHARVTGN